MGDLAGDPHHLLAELKAICLPLMALLQEDCTGTAQAVTSASFKELVSQLETLLTTPSLPRRSVAASVPLALLPLYLLLTQRIGTKELKPSEAALEAMIYSCVQVVCERCGPSIIEADPSVYLKILTHLVMRVGLLDRVRACSPRNGALLMQCTEDRSRHASLSHVQGAVLRCLGALLMAPQSQASQASMVEEEGGGEGGEEGGGIEPPRLYTSRRASILSPYEEEQWGHLKRVLAKAAGGGLLAQTVQGVLDIAAKDRERSIRVSALSVLDALVGLFPYAGVWRPFYPGVFGGLVKVILGDFKQGSRLTGLALGLLLEVTALVTSQEANKSILSSHPCGQEGVLSTLMELRGSCTGGDNRGEGGEDDEVWMPPQVHVEATKEWAASTMHQLAQLFPIVLRVCRGHLKARVRAQLLVGAQRILREGGRVFVTLGGEEGERISSLLLDTVVGMQQDECMPLASQARVATTQLMLSLPPSVTSTVLDRLVDLFQEVPAAALSTDGQSRRVTIDLLTGYVSALSQQTSSSLPQALCTSVNVIMEALSQALEFERPTHSHARVLQVIEALPSEGEGEGGIVPSSGPVGNLGYYRSHFHHFRDAQCLASVKALLGALGGASHEFVHMVVDHVVGEVKGGGPKLRRRRRKREDTVGSVQVEEDEEVGGLRVGARVQWVADRLPQVFIMSGVLKGAKGLSPSLVTPTVQYLIDEVVAAPRGVWHTATSLEEEEEASPITAELLNCQALLLSLLLEGVADAAEAIGKDHFEPLLQYTLYPVLAKTGDGHPVVRQAAVTTLHRLSLLLGQGSIQSLLSRNLDYVLQPLYSRVNRGMSSLPSSGTNTRTFPVGPGVMESLLTYTQQQAEGDQGGGGAPFALMREVASIVFKVLDDQSTAVMPSDSYLNGMMKVLLAMVRAVAVRPPLEGGRGKARRGERHAVRVQAKCYWHHRIVQDLGMERRRAEGGKQGVNAEEYFRNHHAEKAREGGRDKEPEGEDLLEIEKLLGPVEEGEDLRPMDKEDDWEADDKPGPQESVMLEVLDRCAYFLASPSLLVQHTVVQVILEGLSKLRHRRFVLLPTLHKLWPALVARLHAATELVTQVKPSPGMDVDAFNSSQSFAMALLARVMGLMGDIAGLVGDFLSIKFMDDLWPIMRKLLMFCGRKSQARGLLPSKSLQVIKSAEAGGGDAEGSVIARQGGGGFTAMEGKLLEALVRCLKQICQVDDCYHFLTPMASDIVQACSFLLGHERSSWRQEEEEEEDLVVALFKRLARFDQDVVWVVAMEATGCDLSERPLRPAKRGTPAVPDLKRQRGDALLDYLAQGLVEGVWCSVDPEQAKLFATSFT